MPPTDSHNPPTNTPDWDRVRACIAIAEQALADARNATGQPDHPAQRAAFHLGEATAATMQAANALTRRAAS